MKMAAYCVLGCVLALGLSGCGSILPAVHDGVSEANPLARSGASLRVAVDVYKGGLGFTQSDASDARVEGLLEVAKSVFPQFRQRVVYDPNNAIERVFKGRVCKVFFTSEAVSPPVGTHRNCASLVGVSATYDGLVRDVATLNKADTKGILTFAQRTSNLAKLYSRLVLEGTGDRSLRPKSARRLLAVANSLRFIADQLDVAVNYGSLSPEQIPLSAQLRASSTENFTDLYGWRGLAPSQFENWSALSLTDFLTTTGIRTDRDAATALKMLDQLNYWENINQVYASGQGDFSVALIKDDIGNWNIKNFVNDPTELVEAQRKLAVDAVGLLAEDHLPGAKAVSSAQRIIDFANGSSSTTAAFTADDRIVKELDTSRAAEIESLFDTLQAASEKWVDLDKLEMDLSVCEGIADEDEAKLIAEKTRQVDNLANLEAELATLLAEDDDVETVATVDTAPAAAGTVTVVESDKARIALKLADIKTANASLEETQGKIDSLKSAACTPQKDAIATEKAQRKSDLAAFYDGARRHLSEARRVLSAVETQHRNAATNL